MNTDKKLSLIIHLTAVFVMAAVVLVAVFVYRENIFGTPKKIPPDPDPQEAEISDESRTVSAEEETLPPAPEYPPDDYIEAPMSDFIRHMFETAVELPGSARKIEAPPKGRGLDLQYKAVPLSELIPEPFEYFGDILLLGDSVTTGFELYKEKLMFCGEAVLRDIAVVAVGNYGVYNATRDISGVHPILNGQKALPEDIIAQKRQQKIFICLGLNDLVWQTPEEFLGYYSELVGRIKAKNPGKSIAVMSVTPCVAGQTSSALDNYAISEANNLLLEYANEAGLYFIDYAAALRDGENNLDEVFSSDAYTHLTTQAYERLVEYMLYHPVK
ncbi:MAG: GDSL-type esterase/lipase family protein [Oscillospiraceae bacterium]|nr:GDSL-type esterase/lipase family protein [Oscillospiraceae bacterium]